MRIPAPRTSPDYFKNSERCAGDDYPCVVCGRPVKQIPGNYIVHLADGGASLVTEDEPIEESSDMGAYPIGRDCLNKHPELTPFATMIESEPDNADDPDYGIARGF